MMIALIRGIHILSQYVVTASLGYLPPKAGKAATTRYTSPPEAGLMQPAHISLDEQGNEAKKITNKCIEINYTSKFRINILVKKQTKKTGQNTEVDYKSISPPGRENVNHTTAGWACGNAMPAWYISRPRGEGRTISLYISPPEAGIQHDIYTPPAGGDAKI
jgi:predicted porin